MISVNLNALAEDVNREHHLGNLAAATALGHFIRAGELLAEAKAQVPGGTWVQWVRDNFEGSHNTAMLYMRVAHYQDEIPEEATSLTQAMNAVRTLPRVDYAQLGVRPEPRPKTARETEMQRRRRERRRREREALKRQVAQQAARKRGGTAAHAYQHVRLALGDLERMMNEEEDVEVRGRIQKAMTCLYKAEDAMNEVLGVQHGRSKTVAA